MLKNTYFGVILSLLLLGCVYHSAPKEDIYFAKITDIGALKGIYQNEGDPEGYLSEFIFGYAPLIQIHNNEEIEHSDIDLIEVNVLGHVVTAKAVKGKCYVYEKEYIFGKDFELINGEIVLKQDFSLLTRGSGDVLVGPSYEKIAIGLDAKGDGVYSNKAYAAGLVFLLFPAAFAGTQEIRFNKSDDYTSYRVCDS